MAAREQVYRDLFPKPVRQPGAGTITVMGVAQTNFRNPRWEFVLPDGSTQVVALAARSLLSAGWVEGASCLLQRSARGSWIAMAEVTPNTNT